MRYIDWYRRVKESHRGRTIFNVHRFLFMMGFITSFITPIFLLFKVSANILTHIRAIIGLTAIVFIALLDPARIYIPISVFIIFRILDHVDGEIARASESSSMLGRYIDGMLDLVSESLLILSYAVALHRIEANYFYLVFGAFNCFLCSLANLNIDRYASYRRWIKDEQDVDVGHVLLDRRSKLLINFFIDLWYLSIFISIFSLKIGVFSLFAVYFVRNLFLYTYYMKLVYKNFKGFTDKPKTHYVSK